jgi:uncharacterized protein (DUF1501 family)
VRETHQRLPETKNGVLHTPYPEVFMLTRRTFLEASLRGSSLLALAPTIPGFLARTARAAAPERDGRILVVVQLDGGNDGINMLVPFADEGYAQHRKALRLPTERLVKVDDHVGLHPAMARAGKLLESGRLAIVPGVGYPNPSRSHFRSMAIWQSARLEPEEHAGQGWLGRGLDANPETGAAALYVGNGPPPVALRGRRAVAAALERLDDFLLDPAAGPGRNILGADGDRDGDDLAAFVRRSTLDAYATADRIAALARDRGGDARYPASGLGDHLRTVARLIKGGLAARVYYTVQEGYDTHAAQLPKHQELLWELSEGLAAFLDDLAAAGLAERVLVFGFSEFGRRVAENGSAGSDHGAAAPVILAGPNVQAGVHGVYPCLTDLEDGDLKQRVDFRQVYATLLEDWLGLPASEALGARFERLALLQDGG